MPILTASNGLVFEGLILAHLLKHLTFNNLLHPNQFDFTKGKSPELAVNIVISTITNSTIS